MCLAAARLPEQENIKENRTVAERELCGLAEGHFAAVLFLDFNNNL